MKVHLTSAEVAALAALAETQLSGNPLVPSWNGSDDRDDDVVASAWLKLVRAQAAALVKK